mgnify:FL=1
MGKMLDSTIAALYKYGKMCYLGEINNKIAEKRVTEEHPEVAVSSARHYMRWYMEMRNGGFLTWNSNSRLLLYYAEHITLEEGKEAGKTAIESAMKFAEHENRDSLIQGLEKLAAKYDITLDEESAGKEKDNTVPAVKEEKPMDPKDIIAQVKSYIRQKGFFYPDGVIENLYLSLKAKPFVILAGISGTGKTRLVRLFAEALGANGENGRYKQVAVRPDWSDSSDLFGHLDLNGHFIAGQLTDFLQDAREHENFPYILCLDEMNLARVEYYMSDLLSIMETREWKENGRIGTDAVSVEGYGDVDLPENLYIIGTVNMDETTFPFSKKVLDRANTIEFSYVDLIPDFSEEPEPLVKKLEVSNSFLRSDYLKIMDCHKEDQENATNYSRELSDINGILEKANAHVGYRVRDEVVFYMLYNDKLGLFSEDEAMDHEILQKILPRIQGSSGAVRDMICELFKHCAEDYEGYRDDSGEVYIKMEAVLAKARKDGKPPRYPKSAEKLAYMMRRYEEDGFTSYWL